MKIKFESTTHLQRFILGILCILLPICSPLFALLGKAIYLNAFPGSYYPAEFASSISITYYSVPFWIITVLTLFAFFMATYKGHDICDRIFTIIGCIFALGIVIFPCNPQGFVKINSLANYPGLFFLPAKISRTLHNICAIILFIDLAIMTLTQFTKGSHKIRNIIYYICGALMILFMILFALYSFNIIGGPIYSILLFEVGLLIPFGIAWITKSQIKITFKNKKDVE